MFLQIFEVNQVENHKNVLISYINGFFVLFPVYYQYYSIGIWT